MIEIRAEGFARAYQKLARLADRDVLVDAGREVAGYVLDNIPPYPRPSRRPMQFKSEKQRRFVMMLVRQGGVPYQRTGDIENSFSAKVHAVGSDVTTSIVNTSVHAPYVIDKRRQAAYHKGHWWTLQDTMQKLRPRINAVYQRWLTRNILNR